MSDGPNAEVPPQVAAPHYGLRSLMLTVAAVAVSLAMMRWWGIFGAAAVFGLALVLSAFATQMWSRSGVRLAFDLTWGIVIPLICLAYDPGIFRDHYAYPDPTGPPPFDPSAWGVRTVFYYVALGYQMLLLAVWIGWGHAMKRIASFVEGGLWVGCLAAVLIGLILLPNSLLGLIVGIGALGFTPWLTAFVFYRRAREAHATAQIRSVARMSYLLRLPGAAVAALLPELVVWLVHGTSGFARMTQVF